MDILTFGIGVACGFLLGLVIGKCVNMIGCL